MAHQCVHCGNNYPDGSRELLAGCSCGSKFFFYLSKEKLAKLNESKTAEELVPLSPQEKEQIEKDVRDIIGIEVKEETPIIMDFESIKVLKPGKYVIDLHNLFDKERPLVYTLEDGKYVVDLTSQVGSKKSI